MESQIATALLAGGFALCGGIGGVLVSGHIGRGAADRKLDAEDERRWLIDRRAAYAKFLGLAESMLREIDGIAAFLSYDGEQPISGEDEEFLQEGLVEYFSKWDDTLQPALGEVQLLATPEVADLADRVSGALMQITGFLETRQPFIDYYPVWFQSRDLVHVLRDAVRNELGLEPIGDEGRSLPKSANWPWLPSRPAPESYVQNHRKTHASGGSPESK